MRLPSLARVEKAIQLPAEQWKGRCYEIACAIVDSGIIKGTPRYGHWLGPIAEESFFGKRRGFPFVQHGWIEVRNKAIVDPTRWVFEAVAPYLYYGTDSDGYYDIGGNQWREALEKPVPEPEGDRDIDFPRIPYALERLGEPPYTNNQLFWLANVSFRRLGDDAKGIYTALESRKMAAYIPFDNWEYVMGKKR